MLLAKWNQVDENEETKQPRHRSKSSNYDVKFVNLQGSKPKADESETTSIEAAVRKMTEDNIRQTGEDDLLDRLESKNIKILNTSSQHSGRSLNQQLL